MKQITTDELARFKKRYENEIKELGKKNELLIAKLNSSFDKQLFLKE